MPLDGDDIALLVVEVGGEVQRHADGGQHLGRDFALGQSGDGLLRNLLHLFLRAFQFLGVLLDEVVGHATENGRKDEKGDDDDEESRDGDDPAFGIDPIFVSKQ